MTIQLQQAASTLSTLGGSLRNLIKDAESSHSDTDVEIFLTTVTPVLAQELLAFNPEQNRIVSKSTVKMYAKKMQEGQWKISAPITFSDTGFLIDGQHRLEAVLKSGCTIDFVVVLGVPEESAENYDRGRKRTATDISRIAGLTWVTAKHTATARYMMAKLVTTEERQRYQVKPIEIENLIPLLVHYKDGVDFAVKNIGQYGVMSLATIMSVVAKVYYIAPKQRPRLYEFCQCIGTNQVVTGFKDNAALKLVAKVTELRQKKSGQNSYYGGAAWSIDLQTECILYTQRALKSFLTGEVPKQLHIPHEDLFVLSDDFDFSNW